MLGKIKLQLLGYITNHPKTWQLKTAIILLSITVCQSGIREVRGSDSGVSVRSQSDVRWGYSHLKAWLGQEDPPLRRLTYMAGVRWEASTPLYLAAWMSLWRGSWFLQVSNPRGQDRICSALLFSPGSTGHIHPVLTQCSGGTPQGMDTRRYGFLGAILDSGYNKSDG